MGPGCEPFFNHVRVAMEPFFWDFVYVFQLNADIFPEQELQVLIC